MKLKYQLSSFNLISKLLLLAILWFYIPFVIEKVIDSNVDKELSEKKSKFLKNLGSEEIHDFLVAGDNSDVYGSFSSLHNEFIQLEPLTKKSPLKKDMYFEEYRKIEGQDAKYRILQHHFLFNKSVFRLEIGSNINEIEELKEEIGQAMLLIFLVISVLTFVLDAFFVNWLLNPFYKIINLKMRQVGSPEKFDYSLIVTNSAEFKELDITLNQMVERINEFFKKEQQFIGNVSHELLTPISVLKNRLENLLQKDALDDYAIDKVSDSLITLDFMNKLIKNLLLISRIENKQYATKDSIDLQEIITGLIENFEDRIQEKGLAVSENLSWKIDLYGNRALIEILISNLLGNAIKYNIQKGSILITDELTDDAYILKISDTGIGMSKEQLLHIFDRFSRFGLEEDGHGIGLAIASSIAVLHHITISVSSETGKGTVFALQFPKPPAD